MAFHGRNKSKFTRLLASVADANYRQLLFTGKFPSATQATRLPASENKQYKTYDRFHGNSPYDKILTKELSQSECLELRQHDLAGLKVLITLLTERVTYIVNIQNRVPCDNTISAFSTM